MIEPVLLCILFGACLVVVITLYLIYATRELQNRIDDQAEHEKNYTQQIAEACRGALNVKKFIYQEEENFYRQMEKERDRNIKEHANNLAVLETVFHHKFHKIETIENKISDLYTKVWNIKATEEKKVCRTAVMNKYLIRRYGRPSRRLRR